MASAMPKQAILRTRESLAYSVSSLTLGMPMRNSLTLKKKN